MCLLHESEIVSRTHCQLNEVGFVWGGICDATWLANYSQLLEHRREFGDAKVMWDSNPELKYWLDKQHARDNEGKLKDDQIAKLHEAGISFD